MQEKAERIAHLIRQKILGGKILNIRLSDKKNPHFARILAQNFQHKRIAVMAELQDETAENLITNALLWFNSLKNLKTKSAEKIWIVSGQGPKLAKLRRALKPDWQLRISIFDYQLIEKDEEFSILKKPKLKRTKANPIIEQITALAPAEIQAQGTNLLYNGLPFASFKGQEVYFGIEQQSQILSGSNWSRLTEMMENFRLYRQADSPNRHHIFYKLFPEAWLESCLRTDISRLDANLILSPVYNQFRASAEQIDLLALRKDGRLVIIELKVAPNREHLFQAVDYWQEIEKHRLAGNLKGLFGKLEMADVPSLVYLVAPHSCFHPNFEFLASVISPEIEIFRFDLNEKWRERIKVLERRKI
jgi:hypothetical protein